MALAAQQDYADAYSAYETELRQWQADERAAGAADPGSPPDPPGEPPSAPAWANR